LVWQATGHPVEFEGVLSEGLSTIGPYGPYECLFIPYH
jgi:hypothetical protein